jgi:hypothetical protein
MKFLLPILLLLPAASVCQQADFIILKKKNKTVETFYSGTHISFTAKSGAYFNNVLINGIKDDTLYIQEFITRYALTTFGAYIIDTLGSNHYKYHYNQVMAIGRKEKTNFNTKGSGAALLGGAVVLTLASGVVYIADRSKFSAPLLVASVGLGTLGYFMAKGRKNGGAMLIGKKYRLVYMNMSNKKI